MEIDTTQLLADEGLRVLVVAVPPQRGDRQFAEF
jgi:hypothetical protein